MRFRSLLALALLATALAGVTPSHAAPVKFTDVYFTVSDGILIDSDVYMPSGWDGHTKVPCLVEHTPYRKENRASEGAAFLPDQGFGLIELDARGSASSQGEYDIVFSTREQLDVAEIIEQAATTGIPGVGQVCLDKVGMYGGSYSGIIQYLVASLPTPPPHLAVIAPQRAYGDLYRDIVYHGGMAIGSFGQIWSAGTTAYYTEPPLNLPDDRAVKAWTDHLTMNDPIMKAYLSAPYADAHFSNSHVDQQLYTDSSILPRIGNLHVPSLHLAGWFDAFTRGQLLTFEKALAQESDGGRGPNYLIIGPWNHSNTHFISPENKPGLKAALAAWYHYWLDGGPRPAFMDGPRVQYWLMGSGSLNDNVNGGWRGASSWPLPEATFRHLYLRSGAALSSVSPAGAEPGDSYVYTPAAGTAELLSRWDNAASGSIPQPQWDQRTDEPKGLSYTYPVTSDLRVAGPINLHLVANTVALDLPYPNADPGLMQLAPPYPDTDFVVKLSDVAPDGTATLITQGYLRASHRALDRASSEFAPDGMVTRAQHFDDSRHVLPVATGVDTVYDIEIWPTAKTFLAGHGLRIDVYSSDTPNHLTLVKPAINTVLHSADAKSFLTIPVLQA